MCVRESVCVYVCERECEYMCVRERINSTTCCVDSNFVSFQNKFNERREI